MSGVIFPNLFARLRLKYPVAQARDGRAAFRAGSIDGRGGPGFCGYQQKDCRIAGK